MPRREARVSRLRWGLLLFPWAVTALWVGQSNPEVEAGTSDPLSRPMLRASAIQQRADPQVEPEPKPDPATDEPILVSVAPALPPDVPTQELFFGDRVGRRVALTFDDGPSPELTGWVLGILRRYDVRATFFMLGERVDRLPDIAAQVARDGHEVGNHTWSHPSLRSLWRSQIEHEVRATSDAIARAIDRQPALFRPPFGRYAPSAVPVIGELGMHMVLWSVDGHDWEYDDPNRVAAAVLDHVTPGSIVLLHDTNAVTARALPAIIEGLRRDGYSLVPVSELTGVVPYRPGREPSPPAATADDR